MQLVIQSHATFIKGESMNKLMLSKVSSLASDVVELIDEFLGGFAFYKLTTNQIPDSAIHLDLGKLLRSNMQDYPKRIGRCTLMLLADLQFDTIPQTQGVFEMTKNTLPISNHLFDTCVKCTMIEYLNRSNGPDNAFYAEILACYLTRVTKTKVHISIA